MRDPAIIVKDLLVNATLGTFNAASGWSIAIGEPPAKPDTVMLVNRVGGKNPYPHLLLNEPSVQILVRGAKGGYVAASAKADAVVNALLGLSSYTDPTSGDVYRSCNQIGDVAYLGQDENTRPLFAVNLWFIVTPAAVAGGNRVAIS